MRLPADVAAAAEKEIAEHKGILLDLEAAFRQALAEGTDSTEAISYVLGGLVLGENPVLLASLLAVAVSMLAERPEGGE